MSKAKLSVREIREQDIDLIISYWMNAEPEFLTGMGVDVSKIPSAQEWRHMLTTQILQPLEQKQSYCIIWQINDEAVGHSNVNKIVFGEEAYMHLHLWHSPFRQLGHGTELVRKTLWYFFTGLQLKKIYCEPFALNPAPNKTLKRVGFSFLKTYLTTPGWLNFEQQVNRWELTREKFEGLQKISEKL